MNLRRTLWKVGSIGCLLLLAAWALATLGTGRVQAAAQGSLTVTSVAPTGVPQVETSTSTATASATQCGPAWLQTQPLNGSSGYTELQSISALSSNNIWAAGHNYSSSGWATIIEHWDGTSWAFSGQSVVGNTWTAIYGIAAISASDVWAAGQQRNSTTTPLLMHWNGSTWTNIDVPGVGNRALLGISAVSANDIWAAGKINDTATFTIHWDGTAWSVVPSANRAYCEDVLFGIAAYTANDAWAVGTEACQSAGPVHNHPLTEHWDGQRWSLVTAPTIPYRDSQLQSVAAASPNDVWAVGYTYANGMDYRSLVEHWDGQAWNIVPSPTIEESSTSTLWSVTAVSPSDVWAVGSYTPQGSSVSRMHILHWDGTSLQAVPGLNPAGGSADLSAVTHIGSGELWAAGSDGMPVVIKKGDDPCATATATATASSQTSTVTATPTSTQCQPAWAQARITSIPAASNDFFGIDARTGSDVWAVGGSYTGTRSTLLASHWDGSQWTTPDSATLNRINGLLIDVAAVGQNDAWAVGDYHSGNITTTLMLHWDGTRWNETAAPSPQGSIASYLYAVDSLASNDIWGAGNALFSGGVQHTFVLHWDGTAWSVVPSPNVTEQNELRGITALAPNDVWAVGSARDTGAVFTQHWDGATWSIVPLPNGGVFGFGSSHLFGVGGAGPNDVWAVGEYTKPYQSGTEALILHWDGIAWSQVNYTSYSSLYSTLYGIKALASNDVWAAGFGRDSCCSPPTYAIIMHWNGSTWETVPGPSVPATTSELLKDITASSPHDVWATGLIGAGTSPDDGLVIHRIEDPCASPTATNTATATIQPSATSTSTASMTSIAATFTPTAAATSTYTMIAASPTSTAAGATSTPPSASSTSTATNIVQTSTVVPTATICDLQFADVPPNNAFYTYTRCLACRGVMSGYTCGGAGEPCDAGANPYFRPSSPITRGQIAKIVANAAGLANAPGVQLFRDVPPDAPFFIWVNRLTLRGVMGGYPCGGPGEPCEDGNLPYFRPNSNATRGQLTKIISNAAGYTDTHTEQTFQDVPTTSAFYTWIQRLASRSVIGGYPCGSSGEPCSATQLPYFRPTSNVTRGQAAKIAGNTFFPECSR